MSVSFRKATIVGTMFAFGFALVPAVTSSPGVVPVAEAAASPEIAPSMVLKTAPSAYWYSKNIAAEHDSSPAVAPVGPKRQMEIIDGFPNGTVQAWSLSGAHLWTFHTGHGAVQAAPVIVDLNKDGRLDVLTADTAGNVWAFTPSLNNRVIFHKVTGDGKHQPGDWATPAVADLNKDGKLDVIETSWDHNIHAWSGAGSHKELPGFPVFLQDTSWSSPAVADIDHDGWPEIVFGYDCRGVAGQKCYPHPGGYIGVLRHDGKWEKGWPKFESQVIWSSPAIVDLFGNGLKEIVVGTGSMPVSSSKKFFAFYSNGSAVPGFPSKQSEEISDSPAVGDVDGDGKKDLVFATNDAMLRVVNRSGKITASTCVAGGWHSCPVHYRPNVSLADINHDGKIDIVVGNEVSIGVYDKVGSSLRRIALYGTYGYYPGAFIAAPTVVQVNGQTWIIAGTTKPGSGSVGNVGKIFIWKINHPLGSAPWPTFRQNFSRTGIAR